MELKEYTKRIKNKFDINLIRKYFESSKKLKVLVIGDTILDHYVFVAPKGRAIKDPILSVEYLNDEIYAGGVLAVANHINDFVKEIKLVTLIGDKNDYNEFIASSLGDKISLKTFIKKDTYTTVKKRYVDNYRNNKLFKIEYINDEPITPQLSEEIVQYLDTELPNYDIVIIADFGHGFIDSNIKRKLEQKSKFLALNIQSNSSNMGYNYFNLYNKINFITMNEQELRLPLLRRFEDIEEVIKETHDKFKFGKILVTIGKKGSIYMNSKGDIIRSPVVTSVVKDTVGAGDAVFAISTLFTYIKAEDELIPFIANCAGGIKANYMGNKESVSKEKLINFIEDLYQNVE